MRNIFQILLFVSLVILVYGAVFSYSLNPSGFFSFDAPQFSPACGDYYCEGNETTQNCVSDCYVLHEPWPNSDFELDTTGGLDIFSSTYQTYFDRLDSPFIGLIQMGISLPDSPEDDPQNPNDYWADPVLVNQYNPDLFTDYDATLHLERAKNYFLSLHPNTTIQSYISGMDCSDVQPGYYDHYVYCNILPSNAKLFNTFGDPTRFLVDIRNDSVRESMTRAIVQQATMRNLSSFYIDNIRHPMVWGTAGTLGISWKNITDYLQRIHTNISARGIRLITNVAVHPALMAQNNFADADMLADAADGFSFEDPLSPTFARPNYLLVQDAFAVYRRWLDDGKTIFFISVVGDSEENKLFEKKFMAVLAMMIRNPGDSIFIDRWYFIAESSFPWKNWSGEFGAPLGLASSSATGQGWNMSRQFSNGTLTLIVVNVTRNQQATVVLPRTDYVNLSSVAKGTFQKTAGSTTYTPVQNTYGVDGLMFGANHVNGFYRDQLLLEYVVNVCINDGFCEYEQGERRYVCGDCEICDRDSVCNNGETNQNCIPDCGAPSNLLTNQPTTSSIELSWQDNSNGETGFFVQRSTSFSFVPSTTYLVAANSVSYTDSGLAHGTTYYYRVKAKSSIGNSSYSNLASATTDECSTCGATGGSSGGSSGGGGSSSSGGTGSEDPDPFNGAGVSGPGCAESWNCDAWSSCAGGIRTRACYDLHACGTFEEAPSFEERCENFNFPIGATGKVRYDFIFAVAVSILSLLVVVSIIIIRSASTNLRRKKLLEKVTLR